MRRTPVQSSTLKSVSYDERSTTLFLEFTSGDLYQYAQVPKPIVDKLLNASSKGTYFNRRIKDKYPFQRITH